MATWVFDRPAGTFTGQADTNNATVNVALADTPAGLEDGSVTAVAIATEANAVDISPGGADDDYGLSVRIISGGVVLAGLTISTYEPVTALQISSNYPLAFAAITPFGYVLTTATKAQWDAATIEYLQLYSKTKGGDNDFVTIAVGSSDITVTYTPGATPVLSNPTEADITDTTVTVGCDTDDNTGTLYYYISTSASAPTAANLKSGSGSVKFGNIGTPTSTQTFGVTGLTQSVTYYTYFIQTNGTGDSNILESGLWLTHSVLTADDLETASEVSVPVVGQEHVLLAADLESASEVSIPVVGQEHVLLAADLESVSEVSQPTAAHIHVLLADDLETVTEVSQPTAAAIDNLLADDLESATEVAIPVVGQEHVLLAADLESASEVSQPTAAHIHDLLAADLESASEVTSPTATEILGVHDLFAADLESASEVSIPVLAENVVYMRPDADDSVGNWTTDTGASTNLYQSIDEDPFNDSDFVRSELEPTTSIYKARLSNPIEAPDSGGNHYVRYRYQKDDVNGQQINLTVRLIQGASTEIASWTHNNIGATISQVSQQLSSPEISSISDYDDLFLEFEADAA